MFNLFKRAEKFVVVEVEKAEAKLPELSAELRESVKTLQHHPGFQYLMAKFRYERAMLEKYLHEGFQLPEAGLRHLQAGVHYMKWMEDEVKKLVFAVERNARTAAQHEVDEFERIRESITLVGEE